MKMWILGTRLVMPCVLAILCDGLAVLVVSRSGPVWLAGACVLHAGAMVLVGWMPTTHRSVQRSDVELQVSQVLTFAVPVIGPGIALGLRRRSARARRRKRNQLEDFYADFLDKPEQPPRRSPFQGNDFEADVARLSDAESFGAVLRYGSSDHKRGVLRRLGGDSSPQSMALLRHCLNSTDGEISLFAYGELDQVEQRLMGEVDEAAARVVANPSEARARTGLAEAHRNLARSGCLDDASTRWHEQEALRIAATGPRAVTEPAAPSVDQGAGPQANLLARAEAAFTARDFDTAREIAATLRDLGAPIPVWLDALADVREETHHEV